LKLEWLKTDYSTPPSVQSDNNVHKRSYLEKTLKEITSFFMNGIFSEEIISRGGLLQSIDPRVKVLAIVIMVITVSLYKQLSILLAAYSATLVLAYFSRIGLKFFLMRVWFFIPLFSGIIAVPALFNIFVPGDSIIDLITLKKDMVFGPLHIPQTIAITRQGALSAALFVMRVATSVSLVVLLTLTTRWTHILKALRVFKVPQFFTFILGMSYRYIHLLLRQIEAVHYARQSRTIGKEEGSSGRKWIISQIKFVLKRSLNIGEQVYSAMVSRGFTYELRTADNFKLKKIDYICAIVSVLLIMVTLGFN